MEPGLDQAAHERVLIINTGSSSLKWTLFEAAGETVLAQDSVAWREGREEQIQAALTPLPPFATVVHRVVHGADVFNKAVELNAAVQAELEGLVSLDPLHMQPALEAVALVAAARPEAKSYATFDTAFHRTLPSAAGYGLPLEWERLYKARRYGFHGLSVAYATVRAEEILGRRPERLLVCHLGSGCSITAVRGGASIDTTMGFSPLEGLIMGTRSGSVDPGLVLRLIQQHGLAAEALEHAMTYESGLRGLSGISASLHDVWSAKQAGDPRAVLAYDRFVWSARRGMGGMVAALGGVDAIVYTGGIGENSAPVRAALTSWLAFAGVSLDESKNEAHEAAADEDLAHTSSKACVLALRAREDLVMLREVQALKGERISLPNDV